MSARKKKRVGKRRTTTVPLNGILGAGLLATAMYEQRRCACYTEGFEAGVRRGKQDAADKIREALDLEEDDY